jgi:hypothetical protein
MGQSPGRLTSRTHSQQLEMEEIMCTFNLGLKSLIFPSISKLLCFHHAPFSCQHEKENIKNCTV